MLRASSLLIALLALMCAATAGSARKELRPLSDDDFDAKVADGLWMVAFLSPSCVHCQRLRTQLHLAATSAATTTTLNFGVVEAPQQSALLDRFRILAFPTVKIFQDGTFVTDFKGPGRNAQDLLRVFGHIARYRLERRVWQSATGMATEELQAELADAQALAPANAAGQTLYACVLLCPFKEQDVAIIQKAIANDKDTAALGVCDEHIIRSFRASALDFSEGTRFLVGALPLDGGDAGADERSRARILALNSRSLIGEAAVTSAPALRTQIADLLWRDVVLLDRQRFSAMRHAGRVAAPPDSSDPHRGVAVLVHRQGSLHYEEAVQRFTRGSLVPSLKKRLRFGIMDQKGPFRHALAHLGVTLLPRVLVFGSDRSTRIWSDAKNLNLTRLEDGLEQVLSGRLEPISGVDFKRSALAQLHVHLSDLAEWTIASYGNLLFVGVLVLTSLAVLSLSCYWVVFEGRRRYNEAAETGASRPRVSTPSTTSPEDAISSPLTSSPPSAALRHRRGDRGATSLSPPESGVGEAKKSQ